LAALARSPTRPIGAYGLRLDVPEAARRLLGPAHSEWPLLTLRSQVGDGALEADRVSDRRAELRLHTGGSVVVDRDAGTVDYTTPRALGPEELVHPFLAPAAAIMAYWAGRPAVHAGAFVLDGRAWGVLGDREAGKSSLLAWLASAGHPIVTDDVLVVEGGRALPGPRSVDLREDAAKRLGVGRRLGTVGARDRWRLDVEAVDGAPELAGLVVLGWGDELRIEEVDGRERVALLQEHAAVRLPSKAPDAFLELVGLPARRFVRSRSWERMPDDVARLLEALSA
jgi:hypothetical protein